MSDPAAHQLCSPAAWIEIVQSMVDLGPWAMKSQRTRPDAGEHSLPACDRLLWIFARDVADAIAFAIRERALNPLQTRPIEDIWNEAIASMQSLIDHVLSFPTNSVVKSLTSVSRALARSNSVPLIRLSVWYMLAKRVLDYFDTQVGTSIRDEGTALLDTLLRLPVICLQEACFVDSSISIDLQYIHVDFEQTKSLWVALWSRGSQKMIRDPTKWALSFAEKLLASIERIEARKSRPKGGMEVAWHVSICCVVISQLASVVGGSNQSGRVEFPAVNDIPKSAFHPFYGILNAFSCINEATLAQAPVQASLLVSCPFCLVDLVDTLSLPNLCYIYVQETIGILADKVSMPDEAVDFVHSLGHLLATVVHAILNSKHEQLVQQLAPLLEVIFQRLRALNQHSWNSDLLRDLSPLLVTLLSNKSLSNRALLFWGETFGRSSALQYPRPLVVIMEQLQRKVAISLPGWIGIGQESAPFPPDSQSQVNPIHAQGLS
jgi:hypothetical protein